MDPKPLVIHNDNNKLQCDAFLQIHFAPDRAVTESEFSQVYVIKHNDQEIFVQLIDFYKISFLSIGSWATIPAHGMESFIWKRRWRELYPSTTDESMMGVYVYQRLKADF